LIDKIDQKVTMMRGRLLTSISQFKTGRQFSFKRSIYCGWKKSSLSSSYSISYSDEGVSKIKKASHLERKGLLLVNVVAVCELLPRSASQSGNGTAVMMSNSDDFQVGEH
jgi:hypothetical protein